MVELVTIKVGWHFMQSARNWILSFLFQIVSQLTFIQWPFMDIIMVYVPIVKKWAMRLCFALQVISTMVIKDIRQIGKLI
jgi:hypothetical protein